MKTISANSILTIEYEHKDEPIILTSLINAEITALLADAEEETIVFDFHGLLGVEYEAVGGIVLLMRVAKMLNKKIKFVNINNKSMLHKAMDKLGIKGAI